MPSNLLLLLALLGGYLFLHLFSLTRIRISLLDGYRLLLESAATGMGFTVATYFVVGILDRIDPALRTNWHRISPTLPYLATVGGGLILAVSLALLGNAVLFLAGFGPERLRRWGVRRYGNELQGMLITALSQDRLVSLTLDNRKCYIGFVASAPALSPAMTHFSVLPFMSGYRETTSLEMKLTTDYSRAYLAGADPDDFLISLALKDVKAAAFFDPDIYPYFFNWKNTAADGGEKT